MIYHEATIRRPQDMWTATCKCGHSSEVFESREELEAAWVSHYPWLWPMTDEELERYALYEPQAGEAA